jgi:hypothetical protein
MGQNRKFEVLGWGLVINWDDDTCVAFNGDTWVVTANDAIEVRAFNPKSNIQAWITAKGLTLLNPELLEQGE